jgi:hypothetical protein
MNLPSTLALALNEHQTLRLAGGVLVASELLPRFVLCAFHFETRVPIQTLQMLFYKFG